MKTIFITGGAGFIGSALIHYLIQTTEYSVVNIDKLTYAGHLESLETIANHSRYSFEKVDITEASAIIELFEKYQPKYVIHLAAESHVDRSIDGPSAFIDTNIVGTSILLQAARTYWMSLKESAKNEFRFHHVSTDEVYGELGLKGFFTEETPYAPRSPYSASKASSDHLVRAWYHTYGLPVLITNCSNNYGPRQFPEKLIPVVLLKARQRENIPIYGKGENIRDWLYVEDHVRAIMTVVENGTIGETYNIGGHNEKTNLEVVHAICSMLDERLGKDGFKHASLITFVKDRPGHDLRYAIDASKIQQKLGWSPEESFETGMKKTVNWYLNNLQWCAEVLGDHDKLERLGLEQKK